MKPFYGDEIYMKKENRDRRYKELKAAGYDVVRKSYRNQLLHPQYVEDFPNKRIKEDTGLGNAWYKTYFKALYIVEQR